MSNKIIVHGITSGVISSIAGILYVTIYQSMTFVDFSVIVNFGTIASLCIASCMLMSMGYWILHRIEKMRFVGFLHLFILLVSFASIIVPIGITLPLTFDFPELFPGLVIPMHFFPALFFFGLKDFFFKK